MSEAKDIRTLRLPARPNTDVTLQRLTDKLFWGAIGSLRLLFVEEQHPPYPETRAQAQVYVEWLETTDRLHLLPARELEELYELAEREEDEVATTKRQPTSHPPPATTHEPVAHVTGFTAPDNIHHIALLDTTTLAALEFMGFRTGLARGLWYQTGPCRTVSELQKLLEPASPAAATKTATTAKTLQLPATTVLELRQVLEPATTSGVTALPRVHADPLPITEDVLAILAPEVIPEWRQHLRNIQVGKILEPTAKASPVTDTKAPAKLTTGQLFSLATYGAMGTAAKAHVNQELPFLQHPSRTVATLKTAHLEVDEQQFLRKYDALMKANGDVALVFHELNFHPVLAVRLQLLVGPATKWPDRTFYVVERLYEHTHLHDKWLDRHLAALMLPELALSVIAYGHCMS